MQFMHFHNTLLTKAYKVREWPLEKLTCVDDVDKMFLKRMAILQRLQSNQAISDQDNMQ